MSYLSQYGSNLLGAIAYAYQVFLLLATLYRKAFHKWGPLSEKVKERVRVTITY